MRTESVVVNTAKLTRGTLMTRSEMAGRNGTDLNTIEPARISCALKSSCGIPSQLEKYK